jgi:hypothetical protein
MTKEKQMHLFRIYHDEDKVPYIKKARIVKEQNTRFVMNSDDVDRNDKFIHFVNIGDFSTDETFGKGLKYPIIAWFDKEKAIDYIEQKQIKRISDLEKKLEQERNKLEKIQSIS